MANNGIGGLVAVRRMDKNGVWATKYVRPEKAASATRATAIPPAPLPSPQRSPAIIESAHIADTADPRVQRGEVINRIVHDGSLFARVGEGMAPGSGFGSMRVQLSRPLRDGDEDRIAALVGYAARVELKLSLDNRHKVKAVECDTPYSVILSIPTYTTNSSDFSRSARHFHRKLPEMLAEGSPVRKTDNAGPGTKGTRLVHGFDEERLSFEVYYDDVEGDPAIETAAERGTLDIEVLDAVLSHNVAALSSGAL